jgi:hypothetical protein
MSKIKKHSVDPRIAQLLLSAGPVLEIEDISKIDYGFFYMPDPKLDPLEYGGSGRVAHILDRHGLNMTSIVTVVPDNLDLEQAHGPLVWKKSPDDDWGIAFLRCMGLDNEIRILKYLRTFAQTVIAPLKTEPRWAVTTAFVDVMFLVIERDEGAAGFEDFKPEFGREIPPSWIFEPVETRSIDRRAEYDQNGFCGIFDEGKYSIFHRINPYEVQDFFNQDDIHGDGPPNHDWHSGKSACLQIAYDLVTALFDEDLAVQVYDEFSVRVIERLPRIWWAISETTVRNTVAEILQEQESA